MTRTCKRSYTSHTLLVGSSVNLKRSLRVVVGLIDVNIAWQLRRAKMAKLSTPIRKRPACPDSRG